MRFHQDIIISRDRWPRNACRFDATHHTKPTFSRRKCDTRRYMYIHTSTVHEPVVCIFIGADTSTVKNGRVFVGYYSGAFHFAIIPSAPFVLGVGSPGHIPTRLLLYARLILTKRISNPLNCLVHPASCCPNRAWDGTGTSANHRPKIAMTGPSVPHPHRRWISR